MVCFGCNEQAAPIVSPSGSTGAFRDGGSIEPAATRKKAISRSGELGEFKLSLENCTNFGDFEKATSAVVPLVVGVAAGDSNGKSFTPRESGSGIILTQKGFVLTHYHTVSEYEVVRIRLADGSLVEAERMGEDLASDLVLLKIREGEYPEPRFASADTLRMGQWVASVGSPFGLQQSVSAGIVSSSFRPNATPGEDELIRFVQSDVVIHRGSSGGPLIDACGRLVAMNSAILVPGMSFSIRIDQALAIAEKLYAESEFERGYIGVSLVKASKPTQNQSPLIIRQVIVDGPAFQAGLRKGDIIVKVDGERMKSHHQLKWLVATTEVGETLSVTAIRKQQELQVLIEVDSRP